MTLNQSSIFPNQNTKSLLQIEADLRDITDIKTPKLPRLNHT
jgi:hypothetical protein